LEQQKATALKPNVEVQLLIQEIRGFKFSQMM
jgi:hypothetical protein